MIPISAKPKRFPSTLSPAGLGHQFLVQRSAMATRPFSSVIDKQYFSSMQHVVKAHPKPHSYAKILNVVQKQKEERHTPVQQSIKTDELYGPRNSQWWTGKHPLESTYINGQPHAYPLLSLEKGKCTRESMQKYFDNTWTSTESLFACLQGEEAFHVPPPHNLRHPLIFYYGHPAALYVNKLRVAGLLSKPINPYFEQILETGVDEMSWDDMSKNKMPWPKVDEVKQYRKQVYEAVTNLISSLTDDQCANINQNTPLWALVMSFEHERIHIETTSVLLTELPLKYVKFPKNYLAPYYPYQQSHIRHPTEGKDYPKNEFLKVNTKEIKLGKSNEEPSFGWDNEYGHRKYQVPSFEASQYKITNGEYYQFVLDGGYSKPEYWSKTGWQWRAFRNAKWPTFWQSVGPQGLHQYDLRVMFDVLPMQWSWPVVVNFHESEAFANWKTSQLSSTEKDSKLKYRVMSELEHHAIRDNVQTTQDLVTNETLLNQSMADSIKINSNMSYSSMSPVDAFPPNKNGFYDVFGNAWEWNIDYFSPLNEFKVHPYYEDFSTPCFDGLHHVIQGSSFISSGNEASIYSRYHFRPHFFQHASFRLVKQDMHVECLTSDTDSPGPYVGNYPFRQSKAGLEKSFAEKNNFNQNTATHLMSKHFDTLPSSFTTITGMNNVNNNTNDENKKSSPSYGYQLMADSIMNMYSKHCPNQSIVQANVIDVGCGVGGLTFRLSDSTRYVLGIDHDQKSIEQAQVIATTGIINYQLNSFSQNHMQSFQTTIDTLLSSKSKSLKSSSLPLTTKVTPPTAVTVATVANTEFRCSDPMCLPAELYDFDIVILNDVIDKVSVPNSVLGRLGGARGLTKKGGLLFIASSYQWNENKTPKGLWLNKDTIDTTNTSSSLSLSSSDEAIEELKKRLLVDFEFINTMEIPMLWRETLYDFKGKVLSFAVFQRK